MCRDALLHRAHEIQPALFDLEKSKKLFFFFFFFFDKSRTSLLQEPELGNCPLKSLRISHFAILGCDFRPELAVSGGSSAVEQRTVKCVRRAAILWSGVQISLSGFF